MKRLLFLFTVSFFIQIDSAGSQYPAGEFSQSQFHEAKHESVLHLIISLDVKNQPIRVVLDMLAELTGARFLYDNSIFDGLPNITATYEYIRLQNILDDIFKNPQITYVASQAGQIVIAKESRVRQETGDITVTVKSGDERILPGANVVIVETKQGAATNERGVSRFLNIPPGVYTIEVSFIGYETQRKEIRVDREKTTLVEIKLISTAFLIGEIEVRATREILLPEVPETRTIISGSEVEHLQASSLGDVLHLVPGIQQSANPGLSRSSLAAIRGYDRDEMATFGTRIIIDDMPLSSNAELQFERHTSAATGISTLGRGIDLRTIPADNIEEVEVIRGLPSVRYGELTSGIIRVRTRTGPQPHRLKIKQNPDTKEGNFGGGFRWKTTDLSYNLNAARSERDIRKTGDEYTRLTGQVALTNRLLDNKLRIDHTARAQRVFDEEEPKGDMLRTRNYNRGYSLSYNVRSRYKPDDHSEIYATTYLRYRRENSMRSRLRTELLITPAGDTVATYIGRVETKGNEWTAGGRLEYDRKFSFDNFVYNVLIGSEIQYDANTGEGVMIDTVFNYYGAESGRRPYGFDIIPGQVIASLYAENRFSGKLLLDYVFILGARYDMYRPRSINFSGLFGTGDFVESYQGSFLNPRASLMLNMTQNIQFRFSGGITSKSPPMSRMYPPPDVFTWRNPEENTIVHLRNDRSSPYLQAYREKQLEMSYDQRIRNTLGFSISGYYRERSNDPSTLPEPQFVYSLNDQNRIDYLYYVNSTSRNHNIGWAYNKGVELTVRTRQIEPLNTEFIVTGAYSYTKTGADGYLYDANPRLDWGQYHNYEIPGLPDTLWGMIYPRGSNWRDRIVMNYNVRYMNSTLGVWITFRAEHQVWSRRQTTNLKPLDPAMAPETVIMDRLWSDRLFEEPHKFLFNINISKALYRGAEISFYVNNFLDDPGYWRYQRVWNDPADIVESPRNPSLFYGIEFSMSFDSLFR